MGLLLPSNSYHRTSAIPFLEFRCQGPTLALEESSLGGKTQRSSALSQEAWESGAEDMQAVRDQQQPRARVAAHAHGHHPWCSHLSLTTCSPLPRYHRVFKPQIRPRTLKPAVFLLTLLVNPYTSTIPRNTQPCCPTCPSLCSHLFLHSLSENLKSAFPAVSIPEVRTDLTTNAARNPSGN